MNNSIVYNKANELRNCIGDKIPVDVYKICDKLNISITEEEIKSEAYLLCENGKTRIIVKTSVNESRKKFSIAHELGHFYLPSHSQIIFNCSNDDMSFKAFKPLENEANAFASQLIMPKETIKTDIIGDIDIDFIRREAEKYDVSISAMAIRLTQLAFDTIAIFYIENERIRWSIKTDDFDFYIKSGKVLPYSLSSRLFEDKVARIIKGKVPSECWLETPKIDEVTEESVYFPNYNSTLTIVRYNPDDIVYNEE